MALKPELMFAEKEAWKHVQKLALGIGARFPGSEKEKEAAAYLEDHYRRLGLDVRRESYRVLSYECRGHSLEILGPGHGRIDCQPMGFSASTARAGVTGETVFINEGEDKYLQGKLRGKVVIAFGTFAAERLAAVMAKKPAAMIVVETRMGPPAHSHFLPEDRARHGGVPTVRVGYAEGLRLVKGQPQKVRINLRFREEEMVSQNIIADLAGTDRARDMIVLCAHYCSTFDIQGACDNAGGTAIVMELARVFARRGSRRSLRFIGFGSEEITCKGSIFHAQQLQKRKKELARHRLCVCFDEHGAVFGRNKLYVFGPAGLKSSVQLMAKKMAFKAMIDENMLSDDAQFARLGVPILGLRRLGMVPLHTVHDNMDGVCPEQLQAHGSFAETWLTASVIRPDVFPFPRRLPSDFNKKYPEPFKKGWAYPWKWRLNREQTVS